MVVAAVGTLRLGLFGILHAASDDALACGVEEGEADAAKTLIAANTTIPIIINIDVLDFIKPPPRLA